MPTFTGKTFATFYKNLLGINQSSNTGVDATTRVVHDGAGNSTALSLSDDVVGVQPVVDNDIAFYIKRQGGDQLFQVNTGLQTIKAGVALRNVLTLYREMGLYEFSVGGAGYHYPLIASNFMSGAESLTSDADWGAATDPPTSLDVSGLTDPENAIFLKGSGVKL